MKIESSVSPEHPLAKPGTDNQDVQLAHKSAQGRNFAQRQ